MFHLQASHVPALNVGIMVHSRIFISCFGRYVCKASSFSNSLHSCKNKKYKNEIRAVHFYSTIEFSSLLISFSKSSTFFRRACSFAKCHPATAAVTERISFAENKSKHIQPINAHHKSSKDSVIPRIKSVSEDICAEDETCKCLEELKENSNEGMLELEGKIKLSSIEEEYEDAFYYIENGLRKVYPYYFTYRTFAKERWVGERILDVLKNDFRVTSDEQYIAHFQRGAITVNTEKVELDYTVKAQDYIENTIHRHEAPILHQPIPIIHIDKHVLVINKPSSVPVHPSGMYRHNSILFLLAKEYNLKGIRSVHRLDRLTSGLLIFGRSKEMAQFLAHQIRNHEVQKEYVCRVEGEFPEKIIECKEPIEELECIIGVGKVSTKGKPCLTIFQKLSYNGKSSVVLCKPRTGRMHQIRIHLQYLGYPIVNDSLYNNFIFGPEKGKLGNMGKTDEELIAALRNIHSREHFSCIEKHSEHIKCNSSKHNISNHSTSVIPGQKVIIDNNISECFYESNRMILPSNNYIFKPENWISDEYCFECRLPIIDPIPADLIMHLHAWKYQGKGWSYKTELPNWAHEDWPHK